MLKIQNLTFSYQAGKEKHSVFQELNIDFQTGFNVILGPNGAGKTTLMKMIAGLLPFQGEILFNCRNLKEMEFEEKMQLISYLPQMDTTGSALTVLEMVLLGRLPELGRRIKDGDLEIVLEALRTLGIEELASRTFSKLSGGQQKLVLIAQTLVRNPALLLLDEPVNSLDMQKQLELCSLLAEISQSRSIEVIAILHDINLAARFADYLVILTDGGKIYSQGAPHQVITGEMLREVYGVSGRVAADEDGTPYIIANKSIKNKCYN